MILSYLHLQLLTDLCGKVQAQTRAKSSRVPKVVSQSMHKRSSKPTCNVAQTIAVVIGHQDIPEPYPNRKLSQLQLLRRTVHRPFAKNQVLLVDVPRIRLQHPIHGITIKKMKTKIQPSLPIYHDTMLLSPKVIYRSSDALRSRVAC